MSMVVVLSRSCPDLCPDLKVYFYDGCGVVEGILDIMRLIGRR